MNRSHALGLLGLFGVLAATACALNPQPIPPEDGAAGVGDDERHSASPRADASVPSGSSSSGGGSSSSGGGEVEAGVNPNDGDAGDAGEPDASDPDASDADASDDAGD